MQMHQVHHFLALRETLNFTRAAETNQVVRSRSDRRSGHGARIWYCRDCTSRRFRLSAISCSVSGCLPLMASLFRLFRRPRVDAPVWSGRHDSHDWRAPRRLFAVLRSAVSNPR